MRKASLAKPGSKAAPVLEMRPSTLQKQKRKLVRDVIWDAAIGLFAQNGFDRTTVDEIAQAAGVSRRTFFRYFSSKSDLMASALMNYGDDVIQAIQTCPPADPWPDIFRKTVLRVVRNSAVHPRTRQIMQIAASCPEARDAQLSRVSEVQDRIAEAFAKRCAEDCGEGNVTGHVFAGLTLSVVGVTLGSWFHRSDQDISIAVEQAFVALSRLVCDGKKGTRGQRARRN